MTLSPTQEIVFGTVTPEPARAVMTRYLAIDRMGRGQELAGASDVSTYRTPGVRDGRSIRLAPMNCRYVTGP
jgi:hypothetical protein